MVRVPRTIVITGGTVSGIGKGITAAALGNLLIRAGFSVFPVKADPYLNRDAGTMNPFQHGEVFVTDDGAETDLDLGHYERFLDCNVTSLSNFTSGAVFHSVMELEREGEFLGKTIQIIPHVTDEIKRRIRLARQNSHCDILTVEIGGTVGDIEAQPFIEAARQLRQEDPIGHVLNLHVVKMDYIYPSDEGKTKPIQHAVTAVRGYGLQPDVLIIRCKRPITVEELEKISLFTGVRPECVIAAPDADSLYDIPEIMEAHGLAKAVLSFFGLSPQLTPTAKQVRADWKCVRDQVKQQKTEVKIGLVGKYLDQGDAYLSVVEAVAHAGLATGTKTKVVPISAESETLVQDLAAVDGIIVPGGFGDRGVDGKIEAISYARTNHLPMLGICLGLQLTVVEYARNVMGLAQANSTEFDPKTPDPVIDFIPGQEAIRRKGGTMRLGSYPAILSSQSLAEALYTQWTPELLEKNAQGKAITRERHRHRYEVHPEYMERLEAAGLRISGLSPDGSLVEYVELPQNQHPFFIATQAHPEFTSRPTRAQALFAGLVQAACTRSRVSKNT